MWGGPFQEEGTSAYRGARRDGISVARSIVLGHIGSFRDGWAPRRTLARWSGTSIRTSQRAITQGKQLGRLGVARFKTGETPPGAIHPMWCGGSHRWTIGWGKQGAAKSEAIARARLKMAQRTALGVTRAATCKGSPIIPARAHAPAQRAPRRWTAEQLDAELARLPIGEPTSKPRDGPG
jgi:hypothetical protein